MPIVKTVKGDLIRMFRQGQFNQIAHGCNCFHLMGAGIALQIAMEFPEVLKVDKETIYGNKYKLGSISHAHTEFGHIANLYTQYQPGRVPVKQELYDAIQMSFYALNKDAPNKDWRVGIPLIGAGIAGGNWPKIEKLIHEVTPNLEIIVVEYQVK